MMKTILPLAIVVAAALSGAVHGQAPAVAPMVVEPTDGEVRKVDQANRKITLKHGEIRNLGMPPMAMVFDVRDGALIDKLKAGDKVRFKATYEGGKYIVTEIQPVK